MTEQHMQGIATDINLIAIGLLAVTLLMMPHPWKNFRHYYTHMSSDNWNAAVRPALICGGFSLATFLISIVMGLFVFELVSDAIAVGLVVLISLVLIFTLVSWASNFLRNRSLPKINWSNGPSAALPDNLFAFVYSLSIIHFALAILFIAFSMLASVDTALSISIRESTQEDFELSRWTLRVVVYSFVIGLLTLGFAEVMNVSELAEHQTPQIKAT